MLLIGLVYVLMPSILAHIYIDIDNPHNAETLALVKVFFIITAISQCFDGIRNVLAGAYRGIQETKTPMRVSISMLWIFTMPFAYFLGFTLHGGAVGIRWGFAIGMILASCLLAKYWYRVDLKQLLASVWPWKQKGL